MLYEVITMHVLRPWLAVSRHAAFDNVGDEHLRLRQFDGLQHLAEHPVLLNAEETADRNRPGALERQPVPDHQQPRPDVPLAGDRDNPVLRQPAGGTDLDLAANIGKRRLGGT